MTENCMDDEMKCPVHGGFKTGDLANKSWWPEQLNLKILNQNIFVAGEDFSLFLKLGSFLPLLKKGNFLLFVVELRHPALYLIFELPLFQNLFNQ